MGDFYSHQKSEVVGDSKTKWILIYSLSYEKSRGCYQAIGEIWIDNDGSLSE